MNMSYCKFRNTLTDLRDCYSTMNELVELYGDLENREVRESMSEEEHHAMECMRELISNMAHDFS